MHSSVNASRRGTIRLFRFQCILFLSEQREHSTLTLLQTLRRAGVLDSCHRPCCPAHAHCPGQCLQWPAPLTPGDAAVLRIGCRFTHSAPFHSGLCVTVNSTVFWIVPKRDALTDRSSSCIPGTYSWAFNILRPTCHDQREQAASTFIFLGGGF